ncbi:hypothetical protein QQS21_012494 [Conoideocrella luteorostrata]|uniref:Uncharacterized protein n=1 Tax=Conoideocrella luteorostrata TaxID=1105319 RepID=A0AAJ0CB24_9HYPO|nr:hypothetical protein QQS21_012494 [Conoideocrella luteorostrata]
MVAASPTSQAPTWVALASEEAEELDEPPELKQKFERTTIRRPQDQASLLTKAIMGEPEELPSHPTNSILMNSQRRRSMTSNFSVASTADLTSDTGMTSPCRTNTPSPPIPELTTLRLHHDINESKHVPAINVSAPQAPKKRCIQFACAAKPTAQAELMVKAPSAEQVPRRPSIKFACPAPRPASTQNTPPRRANEPANLPSLPANAESPSTPKKTSALSMALHISPRSSAVRRLSNKTTLSRPKFLRANSKDLVKDGSQFHEFASGTAREEDWIRQPPSAVVTKITIDDTLSKENHFRRIGAEAEEEAEMEEAEEEAAEDDAEDEDDDNDSDDSDDNDIEDEEEDFDEDSDGYHTDSETGFAESDDDEDGDENMMLWTPSHATIRHNKTAALVRRPSVNEPQSDSSAASHDSRSSMRRIKTRRIKIESDTPDLPDSTDFVCGTLDEDRPLEEAYLSCLAARRNEKLRVIPQDIDPSFPASDPDNDEEEEIYNPVHHDSDEDVWVQGKMEDLHHGQQDRSRRRRRSEQASPRKFRSPPPAIRRHHSPPPKIRGRSPKTLFGRQSPNRRMRSPAPKAFNTPTQTPRQGPHVQFHLAGRPGMTLTKSLPRPSALFTAAKGGRPTKHQHSSDCHLRGAIDIVKGLERKRQRRKEKFFQKYCNRARRGQIPERKPQPGRGAERMKELGLLMAGKKDQGNYVISI